jgi:NAD(P)-dependent dehydrogenase (short-subunit alcohol dehydrogenase family)
MDAIDTLLDRSIVLGYGNVGLWLRRRLPGWPADPPRMDGKVVLITGAASGLGLAAARGYARLGATVHVLARNAQRATDAKWHVERAVPGAEVREQVCDVSRLDALAEFTASFVASEDRLDVLVNNAGVMPDERERTVDDVELTFATHVLAPWVLTDRLAPMLSSSRPSRVINVSSGGMYDQSVPEDDVQSAATSYGPKKFYARTKRELMVITEQWAERLASQGVVVHAMHPGWADTEGVQRWMPVFRAASRPIIRNPDEGADTIVWLGGSPEPLRCTGRFWHDRRARPTHYRFGAGDDSERARAQVWDECARLAGAAVPSA